MKKLTFKEYSKLNTQDSKFYIKLVEYGYIDIYQYETLSDMKKLLKMNFHSYNPNFKLIGIRKTDKPLNDKLFKEKENSNDILTLQQDNSKKLKISIERRILEEYAKKFFNWRTPTMKYESYSERVYALGSSDYDRLITFLHKLGY